MPLYPDKTTTINGVKVNEYLLTKHNPNHIDMPTANLPAKPLGITIHNTNWINVASNTTPAEQYTRACVNGNLKTVRVHYYVDDKCAWQNLPLTLSGWHAADGGGPGNRKTISIECIMRNSTDSVSKKSEDNCAKLAAWLLHKYGLNVEDNLFTHTHWLNVRDRKKGTNDYLNTAHNSYKMCPAYILPHWAQFKSKVATYLAQLNGSKAPTVTPTTPTSTSELYRVRKTWADSSSQIGAYSSLENAKKACKTGYSVFDSKGNVVYTPSATSSTSSSSTVDVYYRTYTGGKWLPEVKNYNETNSNGYAGIENKTIRGLAIKSSKGYVKYRVHIKGGGWLSWITKCDINNWSTGCAGLKTQDIDAIQMELVNCPGYKIQYRVSPRGKNTYYSWVTGLEDYAGVIGKPIDKVQIRISR